MNLSEWNTWILENQAIFATFAIPLFTVILSFIGTFLVHRAKAAETRLNGRIKLSEYRYQNFQVILDNLTELQKIFLQRVIDAKQHKDEGEVFSVDRGTLEDLLRLANDVLVRLRATNEKEREDFMDAVGEMLNRSVYEKHGESDTITIARFREICRKLIESEWLIVESELKNLDK